MFPTRVQGEILKKHKYMNCETDRVHKQRQAKRLLLGDGKKRTCSLPRSFVICIFFFFILRLGTDISKPEAQSVNRFLKKCLERTVAFFSDRHH